METKTTTVIGFIRTPHAIRVANTANLDIYVNSRREADTYRSLKDKEATFVGRKLPAKTGKTSRTVWDLVLDEIPEDFEFSQPGSVSDDEPAF